MNFTGGVSPFAHVWEWWVEPRLVTQMSLKISLEGTIGDPEGNFFQANFCKGSGLWKE